MTVPISGARSLYMGTLWRAFAELLRKKNIGLLPVVDVTSAYWAQYDNLMARHLNVVLATNTWLLYGL